MARLGRAQHFRPQILRPDLGPVYFDGGSTSTYEAALSTYNWTHVIGTNNNRLLVVGVAIFASGTVSSITLGGQSLSFLRSDVNGVYRSELWYLVAPASGVGTITVTLSGSLTSIAGAASWWNVDQFVPFSASGGANGTNTPASIAITPTTITNRVFGVLAAQTASGLTDQIHQAPHYASTGALGSGLGSELGIILTAVSTTLQWNGLGATDSWAVSAVAIQPNTGNLPLSWMPILRTTRGQPVGVVASGFTPGSVTGS
jgi:hypothetical protein